MIILIYFCLFSGKSMEIGISDFLKLMSRPPTIWGDKLDFPLLKSLDDDLMNFIYGMFNFDPEMSVRDYMDVSVPNFENMSLASYCTNVDDEKVNKYCQMAENLPDLDEIMSLMYLASSPTTISSVKLNNKIKLVRN